MDAQNIIPAFGLYGERDPFPDVIHFETFSARAPIHDWRILPHRHGQMSQLFMLENGWIKAEVDDRRFSMSPGEFLYIPEHCVHQFVFEPGTSGGLFSFPISVVSTISPETDRVLSSLSHPFGGAMTDTLEALATMLRDAAQETTRFRAQRVVGLAHSVLSLLAEHRLSASERRTTAKPARLFDLDRLIATHLGEGWTASDFASALSISTGHLSRLCRQATGLGAAAYIEQKIMDEACRLLAFTQLPVSEVGYRLGFTDPSYFSKRFRAARKQTPTAYRALFTR